jgi:hypothetical protein
MRGVSLSHATSPSETRSQRYWAVPRPLRVSQRLGPLAICGSQPCWDCSATRHRCLVINGSPSQRGACAIVGRRSGRPGFNRYRVHYRAWVISKYATVTRFMVYHQQKTNHRG